MGHRDRAQLIPIALWNPAMPSLLGVAAWHPPAPPRRSPRGAAALAARGAAWPLPARSCGSSTRRRPTCPPLAWLACVAALALPARAPPALLVPALLAAGLAIGTKTTAAPDRARRAGARRDTGARPAARAGRAGSRSGWPAPSWSAASGTCATSSSTARRCGPSRAGPWGDPPPRFLGLDRRHLRPAAARDARRPPRRVRRAHGRRLCSRWPRRSLALGVARGDRPAARRSRALVLTGWARRAGASGLVHGLGHRPAVDERGHRPGHLVAVGHALPAPRRRPRGSSPLAARPRARARPGRPPGRGGAGRRAGVEPRRRRRSRRALHAPGPRRRRRAGGLAALRPRPARRGARPPAGPSPPRPRAAAVLAAAWWSAPCSPR